eukprot:scaffold1137_cov280-Prasinococcus_capsulatus_cf.AAC.2
MARMENSEAMVEEREREIQNIVTQLNDLAQVGPAAADRRADGRIGCACRASCACVSDVRCGARRQVMRDLSVLVIDQGTILDRIDYNIEQTAEHVEKAVEELQKADKAPPSPYPAPGCAQRRRRRRARATRVCAGAATCRHEGARERETHGAAACAAGRERVRVLVAVLDNKSGLPRSVEALDEHAERDEGDVERHQQGAVARGDVAAAARDHEQRAHEGDDQRGEGQQDVGVRLQHEGLRQRARRGEAQADAHAEQQIEQRRRKAPRHRHRRMPCAHASHATPRPRDERVASRRGRVCAQRVCHRAAPGAHPTWRWRRRPPGRRCCCPTPAR